MADPRDTQPCNRMAGVRRRALAAALLVAVALAVSGAGCAKAAAKSAPDGPPLAMPAPPPRVLAPVDAPLPNAPAQPEAAPTTPPQNRPRTQSPRAVTGRPVEADPKPEPPAETPPPAAPAPEPARELRAAPSGRDAAAERAVRDQITRAQRDLNRTDWNRLSPDGRAQYEQAKRFIEQAEDALKDRNFPFAATLADKAAQLATQLAGSV